MKYWLIPLAIVVLAFLIYSNFHLTLTRFTLPGISDLRIALISDLHLGRIAIGNERLCAALRELKPDAVMIAGDLLDKRFPNRKRAYALLEELNRICPVYYVRGNHEVYLQDRQYLETVRKTGTVILENDRTRFGRITLIGLDDASVCGSRQFEMQKAFIEEQLDRLAAEREEYTVLLSHQPQHIDSYSSYPIDLVLCGHVHGGQFRLPFIGGLYGPQQGILPKYSEGMHRMKDTAMIISRGLGNSLFPFRVNNYPEIVLIEMQENRK